VHFGSRHIIGLIGALCFCISHTIAQTSEEKMIRGIIRSKSEDSPVSFAVVSNLDMQIATVSGADGYFEIAALESGNRLKISVIGFKTQEIVAKPTTEVQTFFLEESIGELPEVLIVAGISDQLAKIISDCRKNLEIDVLKSKAFFQLKSFVDGKQVELVETYNNATVWGGDITSLKLKTGRLGLSSFNLGYWVSTAVSRSMLMEKTTNRNENYPISPLQRALPKMKKEWLFSLENVYTETNGDTVYVIEAKPRERDKERFNARFWVNKKNTTLLKLELQLDNIKTHPFQPLFPSDTIQNLNLRVSKVFGGMKKTHTELVEFDAEIFYLNRDGEKYKVDIESFIYCYDWNEQFLLPFYDIEAFRNSDYRMISAVPHNSLFWEKYNRFSKAERDSSGDVFYYQKAELTNRSLFSRNEQMKKGFFEQPFFTWSANKRLRLSVVSSPAPNLLRTTNRQGFSFNVLAFYDLNVFDDTTQILSTTTIDPFNSYWDRPHSDEADAFFNIYMDLIELKRREFHREMLQNPSPERMSILYERYLFEVTAMRTRYFREVGPGVDQKMLRKWNEVVRQKLNIDNMKIFEID
jgi:hypothetical protein